MDNWAAWINFSPYSIMSGLTSKTKKIIGVGVAVAIIAVILLAAYYVTNPINKYSLTSANTLMPGAELPMGTFISNGTASMYMQNDGHLVTYTGTNTPAQTPTDYTGIYGPNIAARVPFAIVSNTGSIVVRSRADGGVIWEGKQSGPVGTWYLKINPDSTLSMIGNGTIRPYGLSVRIY